MKYILLLPDGVGIRNFLLGSFLRLLREQGDVHVLHVFPDPLLQSYTKELASGIHSDTMRSYHENPQSAILRYALAYAHMYWANTQSMRHARTLPVKGSWRTRAMHRAARLFGWRLAAPRGIQALNRWHCQQIVRLPEVEHYRRLFQQIRPSLLFCSHQRPPSILPAVLAAKMLGIPTATFIFSWDNLTSKGRIAAPFDHYLVWSDHMRGELLRYYPDVAVNRVHVVGTPQFDPYADARLLWPREEFFRHVGADPSRPLICYSGGDTMTCPEDPEHVRILLDLIRAGRIERRPQVLLRPAPVDAGNRFDALRRAYPELIYARPLWIHTESGDWSRVMPLPEDVEFLVNLTQHADLNVNLASTMTLDFAIHDRPVVNVAFDVADPPPFGVPLWEFFYQFEHYQSVVKLGAARFARSPDELAQHINDYLADPALDRDGRRRLVELEVGVPLGQSAQRIVEVLETIALADHLIVEGVFQ